MYPATIFNWHDLSEVSTETPVSAIDDAPLLMQVFSADKGSEDLIEISGTEAFLAMYGRPSFTKHGQSSIQAKAIIDAGGRLYAKRVVADDATLGNLIICAVVTTSEANKVKVEWNAKFVEGKKTFEEVLKAADDFAAIDATTGTGTYPIFVYTDNGRGVSGKAIRLNPDYASSKTLGNTFYNLMVYEGTSITEQKTITVNPDVVYSNTAYRLDKYTNVQISGEVIESYYDLYVAGLSKITGVDAETLNTYDIVFGYTNRGTKLDYFTYVEKDAEHPDALDLDVANGIAMDKGTNGSFGDAPVGTSAWESAIESVFNGTFSSEVYDVDQHKIAAILDANYPDSVKAAIYTLVTFREDCVFLRDYGTTTNKTFVDIKAKYDSFAEQRNCFVSDYCTSYLIKDPTTRRNIEVTMLYDMASIIVSHIATNANAPLCGTANGFILSNAIKGSISFTPINTPAANQKESIDNIRVNYAIFEDDNCVVQSCYTSQDKYTQLSYLNNVMGIQRVLRAVRTACPKQRYTLSTSSDLESYSTAVNNVLANFMSNFDQLNFVYTQDELKVSQKIYYASIEFAFLGWAQTEIFDVYAINN